MEEREAFRTWYAQEMTRREVEHDPFDFQKELFEYCQSDVQLLREGCLTFLQDFKAEVGFDPFECMTVASACNRYLRTHCLEENTIAVEPLHGWGGRKVNQSQAAFEWLAWEGHLRDKTFRHAHHGGEFHPLPNRR